MADRVFEGGIQRSSFTYVPLVLVPVAALLALLVPVGRVLVGGVLVLVAPGFLVWRALGRDVRLPRFAAPAVWIALSLSIIPLIFLWASSLGVQLTPAVLQAIFAALGIAALWIAVNRHAARPASRLWLWIGYTGLFALVATTRVLHIRGIALPLWVDSIHHTLLVRVVSETGRIPTSLEPYLPITDLPYHWGYHVVVAAWRGVAGLPLIESVLWSGQVLNALVFPAVYALGASLLRSPRAGLVAAGVAGLVSLMPAYYVTWGRYTQLAGLLVLPALILMSAALFERSFLHWRLLLITAVLLAGLLLIHYRVLVFYAAWMLPYALFLVVRRPGAFGAIAVRGAALAAVSLVLAAPWVWLLARRTLVPLAQAPGGLIGTDSYNIFDRALLLAGYGRPLLVVAGIGAVVALWARRWRVMLCAAWIGVLLLLANPAMIGLPPLWLINNHAVIITLFLPLSLLAAYAVNTVFVLGARFQVRGARLVPFILQPLAFSLLIWSAWNMRSVINTQTILATAADRRAIEWVANNTPPDAMFLTNSTPWIGNAARGTDGGYWLLPLAGRSITTPTALYIYGSAEHKRALDDLNRRVAALRPDDRAALHALVSMAAADYVYVGPHGGPIKSDMLRTDPAFTPVYDRDGVVIAAVRRRP